MLTYTHRYNKTIRWFKTHELPPGLKTEKHHIVPRCLGGSEEESNIVYLPVRWHYVVHCWLPEMYDEQGNKQASEKMLFAWNRMQNYRRGHRSALMHIKEDSMLYSVLREKHSKAVGKVTRKPGKLNHRYGRHWWHDPTTGDSKSLYDKEVPPGWEKGRWISKERFKRSVILKNRRELDEKKAVEHWTKVAEEYNSKGGAYITNKYGRSITILLYNMRKYSKIVPDTADLTGRIMNKGRQDSFTLASRKMNKGDRINMYRRMYSVFCDAGFDEMAKQFGYTHSRNSILWLFKQYVPEYVPKTCNRWKNSNKQQQQNDPCAR